MDLGPGETMISFACSSGPTQQASSPGSPLRKCVWLHGDFDRMSPKATSDSDLLRPFQPPHPHKAPVKGRNGPVWLEYTQTNAQPCMALQGAYKPVADIILANATATN
ncbi:hypothetical protein PAAG_05085 [Paracoccidioides lutzii Pb01]|uniref:Uncharacterized protein n=1 Tax=Paracoccidioides lutzii (strain ATCC MYA-826 / Pb01) TaxID=502779 RepID=C1H2U2_PARBA|nr:hypothetical protein PAAG_05085 [Paracoccidioides lutzii Pb01]EEH34036.2 hypothetical protein PAAG_05085 [Paracoccidioides lutzii Pb01]